MTSIRLSPPVKGWGSIRLPDRCRPGAWVIALSSLSGWLGRAPDPAADHSSGDDGGRCRVAGYRPGSAARYAQKVVRQRPAQVPLTQVGTASVGAAPSISRRLWVSTLLRVSRERDSRWVFRFIVVFLGGLAGRSARRI